MKRRFLPACLPALILVGTACKSSHEFEPPDQEVIVKKAEAKYSSALFDSVTWATDSTRVFRGNEIYAEKCARCHGPLGRGDTPYDQERKLDVPSLVEPGWKLAQIDSLRRTIFVGHANGMPVFGERGSTPRDIDAVATYILQELRPDALSGEKVGS